MAEAGSNGGGNEPRDEAAPSDEAMVEVEVVDIDSDDLDDDVSFIEVAEDSIEIVEDDAMLAEPSAEVTLRERIAELEQEHKTLYERMLRVAADAENLKRRTEREKDEIRRYGTEKIMTDMIPVLDNLERAMGHARTSQDRESLLQGVEMVQRQFEQVLARYGCKPFESLNKPFDPLRHEAVQQVETDAQPPNTVVEEYQKGYFLQDRLVRPALVVVSRLPPGAEAPRAGEVDEAPIAVDAEGEAYAEGPPEAASEAPAAAEDDSVTSPPPDDETVH